MEFQAREQRREPEKQVNHHGEMDGWERSRVKAIGNQAAIQFLKAEETQGKEAHPGAPVIQGVFDRLKKWVLGWSDRLKKFAKSSGWGVLTGLSYSLVGFYNVQNSKITEGQIAGIIGVVINACAFFISIFGAAGWLNTDPDREEVPEFEPESGILTSELVSGAGGLAAIAGDIGTIAKVSNAFTGIAGFICEGVSVLKSIVNIGIVCDDADLSTCEKAIKSIKYVLDLAAGITGAIAFLMSITNPAGAFILFIIEVTIRLVRAIISIIHTIYDYCKHKRDRALSETGSAEGQQDISSHSREEEDIHERTESAVVVPQEG